LQQHSNREKKVFLTLGPGLREFASELLAETVYEECQAVAEQVALETEAETQVMKVLMTTRDKQLATWTH
jgi:hypothetical protein